MTINAIETLYKGRRFRSRLEARWAVFFDALGLRWEYEHEGFELPISGRYLPDFWIRGDKHLSSCYFEIKPDLPNSKEIKKLVRLNDGLEAECYFICGSPGIWFYRPGDNWHEDCAGISYCIISLVRDAYSPRNRLDRMFGHFAECRICKRPTIELHMPDYGAEEYSTRPSAFLYDAHRLSTCFGFGSSSCHDREASECCSKGSSVAGALQVAGTARFEFGECG